MNTQYFFNRWLYAFELFVIAKKRFQRRECSVKLCAQVIDSLKCLDLQDYERRDAVTFNSSNQEEKYLLEIFTNTENSQYSEKIQQI